MVDFELTEVIYDVLPIPEETMISLCSLTRKLALTLGLGLSVPPADVSAEPASLSSTSLTNSPLTTTSAPTFIRGEKLVVNTDPTKHYCVEMSREEGLEQLWRLTYTSPLEEAFLYATDGEYSIWCEVGENEEETSTSIPNKMITSALAFALAEMTQQQEMIPNLKTELYHTHPYLSKDKGIGIEMPLVQHYPHLRFFQYFPSSADLAFFVKVNPLFDTVLAPLARRWTHRHGVVSAYGTYLYSVSGDLYTKIAESLQEEKNTSEIKAVAGDLLTKIADQVDEMDEGRKKRQIRPMNWREVSRQYGKEGINVEFNHYTERGPLPDLIRSNELRVNTSSERHYYTKLPEWEGVQQLHALAQNSLYPEVFTFIKTTDGEEYFVEVGVNEWSDGSFMIDPFSLEQFLERLPSTKKTAVESSARDLTPGKTEPAISYLRYFYLRPKSALSNSSVAYFSDKLRRRYKILERWSQGLSPRELELFVVQQSRDKELLGGGEENIFSKPTFIIAPEGIYSYGVRGTLAREIKQLGTGYPAGSNSLAEKELTKINLMLEKFSQRSGSNLTDEEIKHIFNGSGIVLSYSPLTSDHQLGSGY